MSDGFGMGAFMAGRGHKEAPTAESFGLVEKYAEWLDSREEEKRTGFHISSLYRFCPDRWVLEQILGRKWKPEFNLKYRFDIGSAFHSMTQEHFGDMGILKGYWTCRNGHNTTEITLKPSECPTCGHKRLRYKEVRVSHEVEPGHEILGQTDGIVVWEGEDMGLEIKSVDPTRLPIISKPDDYPVCQLNLYMKLLREQHKLNVKRGIVMYVAGFGKNIILLPIKTYVIDYDESHWDVALAKVKTAIKLWQAHERKELTVRDIMGARPCKIKADGRRLNCTVVEECFSTAKLAKRLEEEYAEAKA